MKFLKIDDEIINLSYIEHVCIDENEYTIEFFSISRPHGLWKYHLSKESYLSVIDKLKEYIL